MSNIDTTFTVVIEEFNNSTTGIKEKRANVKLCDEVVYVSYYPFWYNENQIKHFVLNEVARKLEKVLANG